MTDSDTACRLNPGTRYTLERAWPEASPSPAHDTSTTDTCIYRYVYVHHHRISNPKLSLETSARVKVAQAQALEPSRERESTGAGLGTAKGHKSLRHIYRYTSPCSSLPWPWRNRRETPCGNPKSRRRVRARGFSRQIASQPQLSSAKLSLPALIQLTRSLGRPGRPTKHEYPFLSFPPPRPSLLLSTCPS